MSNLNDNISRTQTAMEDTKCDVGKVLTNNQQVSQTLEEVLNKTISSTSDLELTQQGFLNVKQTLGDLTRHNQNNTSQYHRHISNVQQRLDVISDELQHITSTCEQLAAEQLVAAKQSKEQATSAEFDDMNNVVAVDLPVKEGIEESMLSQLETSVNRSFLSISSEEMVENFVSEAKKSVVLSRSP